MHDDPCKLETQRDRREAEILNELDRLEACEPDELNLGLKQQLTAAMSQLKRDYDDTKNPAYAWIALIQAWSLAEWTNQPIQIPTWVLAYVLASAEGIIGKSVSSRDGNKRNRLNPNTFRDGERIPLFDRLPGLNPDQRLDSAVQALRFKTGRGSSNMLAKAHKHRKIRERVQAIERARDNQGLSLNEAIKISGYREYDGAAGRRRYYRHLSSV